MAISAPGIGSGLDVNEIVSQLMALERRPLEALAQRESSAQSRISAFGQLTSLMSSLQTAANVLGDAAKFAATKATVGANAGFTATSSTSAAAGNYAIEVNQLAKVQRVAVSENAFTTDAGGIAAGSFSLDFGDVDALAGNNPTSSTTLEFAGGSLNDLRDAINAGDLGVRASVINDGSVQRLVLTGAQTGKDQAFTLQGLGLAFDPNSPGAQGDDVFQLQGAQDASLTVDGLAIMRSGNSIDDVIEGVTLTLTREDPGVASSLAVADDPSGARSAISAFVQAYNGAVTGLRNLTRFNPETNEAATLTGDSTARSIQSQLRNIVSAGMGGMGDTTRLSDIGISFQVDGTLAVDNGKLTDALNDPERGVAAFFTGADGAKGFAATVADTIGNLVGSNGMIAGRTDGLKSSINGIENQREALNRRLEATELRLRAQFTALDTMIASMTQTSDYLTQQLANLPGTRMDSRR